MPPRPPLPSDPQAIEAVRALRRHLARLVRKAEAIRGDLAEARRGPEFRRSGEALLAYLHRVPLRSERASLPDPADPSRTLEVALDPRLNPQTNAARYFKRAAKAERGLVEIPSRLDAAEAEIARARDLIERLEAAAAQDAAHASAAAEPRSDAPSAVSSRLLDEVIAVLPPAHRRALASVALPRPTASSTSPRAKPHGLPAKLQPRRLRTREGWSVLIGRSNEGNDHLTHHLARPEDYWFHVHGAPGSHVVLRRGKGKNEPSKQTIAEVAPCAPGNGTPPTSFRFCCASAVGSSWSS